MEKAAYTTSVGGRIVIDEVAEQLKHNQQRMAAQRGVHLRKCREEIDEVSGT